MKLNWTRPRRAVIVRNTLTSAFKVLTNTYGILILAAVAALATWLIAVSALSAAAPDFTSATETEVNADDAGANDDFGNSVAIDGTTAIVGAWLDNFSSTNNGGSAYVFVETGGSWVQQAHLFASDAAASDLLGWSVDLDGDTAIAGAYLDDLNGTADAGSAYVFFRTGTSWSQQAKLTASDPGLDDQFGWSVAIDGDTAVVGALHYDVSEMSNEGAAYVFTRSGTTWSQQSKLTASDAASNDFFGSSVGVSGDTVIVGAEQNDHSGEDDAGAAYVFTRSGTTWSQQAKLIADDADEDDMFGNAVSIAGDTVIIGALDADHNGFDEAGAAYIFTRSGTTWSQQAKLTASDAAEDDTFARSVDIDSDLVIVGAHTEDHDSKNNVGAAYVFTRSGTTWSQQAKLTASDGAADDQFGAGVGIDSSTAIVGAGGHDDSANNGGAAYIFEGEEPSEPTSTGDTGDLSAKIDAIEAKLDASLDATVSSRATQTSVDALTSTVDTIDAAVAVIESKLDALDLGAISAAVGALGIDISIVEAKLDAIEGKLDSLDVTLDLSLLDAVAATADAISAAVGAVEGKLDASLDATVSSRASQASVDALAATADAIDIAVGDLGTDVAIVEAKLDAIEGKLDSLDLSILGAIAGTADAIEVAVGDLDADVAAVEGKLDVLIGTADAISSAVDAVETKLDSLDLSILGAIAGTATP